MSCILTLWKAPLLFFGALLLMSCDSVSTASKQKYLETGPIQSVRFLFIDPDFDEFYAFSQVVYYRMSVKELVASLGRPDIHTKDLEILAQFRLPPDGYAMVWRLETNDLYVVVDSNEKRVSNMIWVNRKDNTGVEWINSKAEVRTTQIVAGMSEAQVENLLGKPDRIEDRDGYGCQDHYVFLYRSTVPANLPLKRTFTAILFSKTERKVIENGKLLISEYTIHSAAAGD